MPRTTLLRRASCLLAALALACVPAPELARDVDVELAFEPAPHVGPTTCTVRLVDEAGAPLAGARLQLEGNMNHAGMVPVFGDAREVAPGVYEAPLEFTMGGDWFVVVRGTLADGRELERIHDLPGVPTEPGAESCCPGEPAGVAAR